MAHGSRPAGSSQGAPEPEKRAQRPPPIDPAVRIVLLLCLTLLVAMGRLPALLSVVVMFQAAGIPVKDIADKIRGIIKAMVK